MSSSKKKEPSSKKKESSSKKKGSSSDARRFRELSKRLKVIYEDEDIEYGEDPSDEEILVDRFTVRSTFITVLLLIFCIRNTEYF